MGVKVHKSLRTLCEVSIQSKYNVYVKSGSLNSNYLAFPVANTFARLKPGACLAWD